MGKWLGLAALLLIFLADLPCRADIAPGQDVFLSAGTAGPLSLSWKPIQPNSLQVKVDGTLEVEGLDYTSDTEAGTITFIHAPAAGSAVTASYSYDTAIALPAGTPLTLPYSWTLQHSGSSSLNLSATYAQSSSAESLQMGLGQNWTGRSGLFLQTQAFYLPLSSNMVEPEGGFSSQTAVDVAAGADAGHWAKLTFGYGRDGIGATSLSGANLPAPGQQTESASAALTLSKQVSATLGYKQADAIAPGAEGASNQDTLAVSATPNSALHINTQVNVTQATGTPQSVATSLSVQDQPAKTVKLAADANVTDPGGTQPQSQTANFSASVAATKQLSLQASTTQSTSAGTSSGQEAASAAWNPNAQLQLNASLTTAQSETSSNQAAGLTVADKLARYLSLNAGYQARNASAGDTNALDHLDSSTVGVTLTPLNRLSLSDTFSDNPADAPVAHGALENAVALSTTFGSLSLSGNYQILDPRDLLEQPWSSTYGVNASLGLWRGLKFTGGFSEAQTGGATGADSRTYSMGLAQNLSDRLNLALSAQMTQQEDPGSTIPQNTACQANANIGLKF